MDKARSKSFEKKSKTGMKGVVKKMKGDTKSILHCEPYTWSRGNCFVNYVEHLPVTSKLYDAIKRKPIIRRSDRGNGYRFGPRLPLSSYKKVSEHGDDGAQTGLIDPTMFRGDDKMIIGNIYRKYHYDWEDRKALKKVQKVYPGILFIGETDGGDVGASLYAHKNKKGVIDSLIIDNEYFFPTSDD